MSVFHNPERELQRLRMRLLVAACLVLACFALVVARLLWLQIVRHDELALQAEANRIAVVPVSPVRGIITDRHGVVLATNVSAHTLELAPRLGRARTDRVLDELSRAVPITPAERRRFRRLAEEYKLAPTLPVRSRLTEEEAARFLGRSYLFPEVELKARLFRHYPLGETASHVLGYLGRVSPRDLQSMQDWPDERQANYRGTEHIGKTGIEQRHEEALHGLTGYEEIETSAAGRPVRTLARREPVPGEKLMLSLDVRLQAMVESLFGERRGALVALDPRNGEVLALVSKPTFDPNLFIDGIDADSWRELNESPDKPLLNRALKGTYPPGSTFKPFMAMAALSSGKRSAGQAIRDEGTFELGSHVFRSHGQERLGMVDMHRAIVKSSNVYFYSLAHELGVDAMHDLLSPFGFGRVTGIDLEGEAAGVLPSTAWKRQQFKRPEQQKWYAGETISLGIGQGYNHFTMLQLASATATLVTGGQRVRPQLLRQVEDPLTRRITPAVAEALPPLPLRTAHVEVLRKALHAVTLDGTSRTVFAGAPYASGGKTGTAQAVGIRQNERYDAKKLEERKRDHSLYIAAAPIEAPTVVVALIVENAGFGSAAAAPIARRVFDYLLLGQYPSEEDIAATRAGRSAAPIGQPRRIDEVALPGAEP